MLYSYSEMQTWLVFWESSSRTYASFASGAVVLDSSLLFLIGELRVRSELEAFP